MKIAIVTDDGRTISAHFGKAAYYTVVTVEGGEVIAREQRAKPTHQHGHHGGHEQAGKVQLHLDAPGEPTHEHEAGHDAVHGPMFAPIRDCQVAITRGMGRPGYDTLRATGIQPILTDVREIDEAVRQYLAGELSDHSERLH